MSLDMYHLNGLTVTDNALGALQVDQYHRKINKIFRISNPYLPIYGRFHYGKFVVRYFNSHRDSLIKPLHNVLGKTSGKPYENVQLGVAEAQAATASTGKLKLSSSLFGSRDKIFLYVERQYCSNQ